MADTPAPVAPVAPAPTPAPAAPPAAPAKAVTPAIPPAQAASVSKPAPKGENLAQKPGETIQQAMKRVSSEVFGGEAPDVKAAKEAAAKAPVEPAKPAAASEAKTQETAPEKKADTPADRFADVAPPDGATEVTQKGWKALKEKANAEIASAERKLAEATAQLDTFRKATPAEAADVAKMQADLKAAHDRLAVLDVAATPDFHKQYVEPQKKALWEATQLIADNGIEGAPEMASLLNLPRNEFAKKVSELAKDMPAFDQSTFVTGMREAYRLQAEQKNALANATELRKNIQAQTAQRQKQAFEETYKQVEERMKPLEVPDGADDAEKESIASYNKELAGFRAAAERNAFASLDERGVASIATKAAALDFVAHHMVPRMQAKYESAMKLIQEQDAKIRELTQAKSAGTFAGDATPPAADTSKGGFAGAMAEAKRMTARGQ